MCDPTAAPTPVVPAAMTPAEPGEGSCGGGGTPRTVYGRTVPEGSVAGLIKGCVGSIERTADEGVCSGGDYIWCEI